ncbi:4Fe-4S ferredoxin [Candidatus Bathyarchaeota archaeon]|nr:4Fe-4S ferredoxin [Candidatus Bathyarchaeota archaeon]
MGNHLAHSGVLSEEELERYGVYPSKERLNEGPVAIIECIQAIPCDPCVHSCPQKAIAMEGLSSVPKLDVGKCIGCTLCIPDCPGQAIFVVDMTYSKDEASVSFPYEFLPIPKVGDRIEAVDREGKPRAKGRVIRVRSDTKTDRTVVLTIAVPKDIALEVRSMRRSRR